MFTPYLSMFSSLTNGQGVAHQASYMQAQIDQTNAANTAAFAGQVSNWTNDAKAARDVTKTAIPAKPVAPLLKVFLRQDLPNGDSWMAEVDGDPVGTCPDLPDPVAPAVSKVTGIVQAGTDQPETQDQKLDDIRADVKAIKAALAKQGVQ